MATNESSPGQSGAFDSIQRAAERTGSIIPPEITPDTVDAEIESLRSHATPGLEKYADLLVFHHAASTLHPPETAPKEESGKLSAKLAPEELKYRNRWKKLLGPILKNYDISFENSGLDRAIELHEQGYGLLVMYPHFGQTDPVHLMKALADIPAFSDSRMITPIARHQTFPKIHLLDRAAKAGIHAYPIVRPKTLERAEKKGNPEGLKLNDGMSDFMAGALDLLKAGGIVSLPPQGTRDSKLRMPDDPVFGTFFFNAALRRKFTKFAIHLVGLGIRTASDYKKVEGLNLLRTYDAYHGPTYTAEELWELVEKDKRGLDPWVIHQLSGLVYSNYLPEEKDEKSQTPTEQ